MCCVGSGGNAKKFFGILDGIQENPAVLTGASGSGTARLRLRWRIRLPSICRFQDSEATRTMRAHSLLCNVNCTERWRCHRFSVRRFSLGCDCGKLQSHVRSWVDRHVQRRVPDRKWRDGQRGSRPPAQFVARTSGTGLGVAYFNIHTTNFPGGEIRGNIAPVPEPSSLVLVALGMSCFIARRRKR